MRKTYLTLGENNWQVHLRDEADQSVYNEIFKLREYRSADDAIKTAKHAIIDAGAHAGFFSLYCRALNEKVKIFAVEPEPNNLELLQRHLVENKILGVKVVAGALAGETEERKLLILKDSHNHSLTPPYPPLKKGGMFEPPLFKAGAGGGQLVVQAFSLADFCKQNKIKKISLLKIDIEGGEYELFEGMSADDFAMVNYVILEYHTDSHKLLSRLGNKQNEKYIEEKLRANGFGVQVFPSHFDKTMGFVWANNKRAKPHPPPLHF